MTAPLDHRALRRPARPSRSPARGGLPARAVAELRRKSIEGNPSLAPQTAIPVPPPGAVTFDPCLFAATAAAHPGTAAIFPGKNFRLPPEAQRAQGAATL